ncbi:MAG: 4-hydroxy-tetrahydrodipicolinate reductase [Firmicutes bacterium]|nr:4-hydroxy-tetrahydrodipicolinate reductase [Bacillota bacterium]
MKILISGTGRMGCAVRDAIAEHPGAEISAMIDENSLDVLSGGKLADVIIDFSHHSMLPVLLEHSRRTETAIVVGTTGIDDELMDKLRANGGYAPTLYSSNYSLGIAVMKHLLPGIKAVLGDQFDIEVCETHHNKKVDAPSGTAKSLIEALDPEGEYKLLYGRQGECGARTKKEIGVHSLRGGTVAGEHTVSFFGTDEVLEVTHRAFDRRIFAKGAVTAAIKLADKPRGFYTLDDLLFEN